MWFSKSKSSGLNYSSTSRSLTFQIYDPKLTKACSEPDNHFVQLVTDIVQKLRVEEDPDLDVVVVDIIKFRIKQITVPIPQKYYYLQVVDSQPGAQTHLRCPFHPAAQLRHH